MFNFIHKNKKTKKAKHKKATVMAMLSLTLSTAVLPVVEGLMMPQTVYADPENTDDNQGANDTNNNQNNDSSNGSDNNNGNSDNKSNNDSNGSDNSDSSNSNSDEPTTQSNDELKTGVSKDGKGNDLAKNLDDARNDLYNSHFPAGVRQGLIKNGGVLNADEGMQLLITYSILKGKYGNGNYHTLMNGSNADELTNSLNNPEGISIKLPKGFGNTELLQMLNANSSAKDGILKDNEGTQTEVGDTQPTNDTKNQNDDAKTQQALEPVAKVLAQNYIKATALPTKHPAQYTAGDEGALALLPINPYDDKGHGGSYYNNGRSIKANPPQAVVKAIEKQILETAPNGSLASFKGKDDKTTKENIIKYLTGLTAEKVANRGSVIDNAIGSDKMPKNKATAFSNNYKNLGGYGITSYGWNNKGFNKKLAGANNLYVMDGTFVGYPINKSKNSVGTLDTEKWTKEDSEAVNQTQYLTPKNDPLSSFKGELTDGWCSNYKRYINQTVKGSGLSASELEKKLSDDDVKTLVSGAKSDAKLAKDTAKATKGLSLLGWDYFTPYTLDKDQNAGNISTTNFKLGSDGKFIEAGDGADNGKPLISQVQNFFVGINGKGGYANASVYKLFAPHSIQFKFGYKQSVGGKKEQTLGDMVGYTNANNSFIQSIKNDFNGKMYLDPIKVSDINNGSGKDKDFNQAISAKEQRLITSTNSLGGIDKSEATDAIGFDNYGNIIDGGKAKVLVPYWQNTMLPQFSSFANSKDSGFVANPVMNDSSAVKSMDGMKGVFGDGKTTLLVGKVTKKQIGTVAKPGSTAYKNAVAVSTALGHGGIKDASDYVSTVNKAVGEKGSGSLSDKACQALAIDITVGTHGQVQAWNQQFMKMTDSEKHLYIGNSLTDNANKNKDNKKSKYSNLFTITDIVQYLGLFFQRGGALVLRKTIVGLIANTYNSTFGQNQSQNIFYTPTFNFLSLFYSMPMAFAFIFAILLILIAVITYIEYAFLGNFGKSKVLTRLLMLIMVVPYFMVLHGIEMDFLNKPSSILLSRPLKMESIIDQYANVREEGALKNVFYSALFGDKFTQINKSTSYAIPFYTTTQVNGQVDTANGKDASEAMKDMTLPEQTEYAQNGFVHAQINNGNGKLPFGTQYRYKKVYVASSDLISWAIHMSRQVLSAEHKIGEGSGYYEQPSHGFKPGQEPLFTWLAEDYKPLGTTIDSNGKSINQNSSNLSVALFGQGAFTGFGGGDPTKGAIADRAKILYQKALGHGYTKEGAAALVGNLDQESSIDPNIVNSIGATGIVQWYQGRNTAMRQAGGYANGKGDLNKQIDFMFKELDTSYKSVGDLLKSSHNLEECSNAIYSKYEVPGDGSQGIRLQYSKQALEGFAGLKADSSASSSGDNNDDNKSDKKDDSNDDQATYDPKDFYEKLNPAEGKMKSAYGLKGGYGASNGQENNNQQYYKDFDHYTEYMVQTNHKASSSAIKYGVDYSSTGGGWLSASQLFLRIWQTTFTTDNNPSGASAMDKYNSLKNFAVAMNGYQNIPTGNASTGYQGGDAKDAKQFTQYQRNDLIDNLSETEEIRQKLNGGFSPNAVRMMGLFNIPQPEHDWLNLESKDSPLSMVLTYYGRYSGRNSRVYDIEQINKKFLNSYLDTYSLDRASLDPDGKDSTTGASDNYNPVSNTYQEDAFSMAEAQIMALEEFFDINKVAGIKVFPTNYSGQAISLDTFNRILFMPIGEIGKELTDNSTYNYDDYNNESPIRMQDNVIEFLSVRNNIFTLLLVLIMNFLLVTFGMVMMLLVKYLLPVVTALAFIRIFAKPDGLTNFKGLLVGSAGLIGVLTLFKSLLAGALSYMSMKMNNQYAMAGSYTSNPTALNAIVISLIVLWFFKFLIKDWFPMLKQNGFLTLGAGDSPKDYFRRVATGSVKNIPIIPKLLKGAGLLSAGILGGSLLRKAGNHIGNGIRKVAGGSFRVFKNKMLPFLARKRQSIKSKMLSLRAEKHNARALKDGSLLDKIGAKTRLFREIASQGTGVKGKLHGLFNAVVGTVMPFAGRVDKAKLDSANKGDLVKSPSNLENLKVKLDDLDENLRNPLINELKKKKYSGVADYDKDTNTVTLYSDADSLKKIGGRNEAIAPLLSAINAVRSPLHKARNISVLKTKFTPYQRTDMAFDTKRMANKTRSEIEELFHKYGLEAPRFDVKDNKHYSMFLTREQQEALNRMKEAERNALLDELQNIKGYQENAIRRISDKNGRIDKRNHDLFNKALEVGGTGLVLTDKMLKDIQDHGMQVINGSQVAYNSHNARQVDYIKQLKKQADKVAMSDGYAHFTNGLINTIAQGVGVSGGNVIYQQRPEQTMTYRVGNLKATKQNMQDLHRIANLPAKTLDKAVQNERTFLNVLNSKFNDGNNNLDYMKKYKAYQKALQGVQINDRGNVNSQAMETLSQINQTLRNYDDSSEIPLRTQKRLNLMFNDLNDELSNRNVLKKVYRNLVKDKNINNDGTLSKAFIEMNNAQRDILSKAKVKSSNLNQGYTPSSLRAVASSVGKLTGAYDNPSTNTIEMYYNQNNSGINRNDIKRLSRMIKYNN